MIGPRSRHKSQLRPPPRPAAAILASARTAAAFFEGAIKGLPEDEREAFDLLGIQWLAHTETAAAVGDSEKTVQRCLHQVRVLLAKQLADSRAVRNLRQLLVAQGVSVRNA
jgi:DNA-directed RNA polymerase specialized sigma24 family protein